MSRLIARKSNEDDFLQEQRKNLLKDIHTRTDNVARQLIDYSLDCDGDRLKDIRNFFHSIKGTASLLRLVTIAETADYYEKYTESLFAEAGLLHEDYYNLLCGFAKLRKLSSDLCMEYDTVNLREAIKQHQDKNKEEYTTIVSEGNILIIDDDPIFLNVIKKLFMNEGYHVFIVSNLSDMFELLEESAIDLIVQDLMMPGVDGVELLQQIKEKYPELPVMILSSKDIVELKVKALKAGANDYLVKTDDTLEILARVETVMNHTRKNKMSLNTDILTGAYTKRYSATLYKESISNYRRKQIEFAVAFVDLDNFKMINNTYGHIYGDNILRDFVKYLKEDFGNNYPVIRFGGDEFVIVFNDCSEQKAFERMEEFKKNLEAKIKVNENYNNLDLFHFSAGIAGFTDEDSDCEKLLDRADTALYTSKKNGKGQISIFHA